MTKLEMASEGVAFIMTLNRDYNKIFVSTTQSGLNELKLAYKDYNPEIYALIPVNNWKHAEKFFAEKFSKKFSKNCNPTYLSFSYPVLNLKEALEYFYKCCKEYQLNF